MQLSDEGQNILLCLNNIKNHLLSSEVNKLCHTGLLLILHMQHFRVFNLANGE